MKQNMNKNIIIDFIRNVLSGKAGIRRDNTPDKVKKMNKSLIHYPGGSNDIFVPKDLYRKYKEALEKYEKGEELTPLEKTRLEGYLNPKYHYASIKYK